MKNPHDPQQTAEQDLLAADAEAQSGDAVSLKRREALKRIAKRASYAAPATLALFSMQARTAS